MAETALKVVPIITVKPIALWKRVGADGRSNQQMLDALRADGIGYGEWAQRRVLQAPSEITRKSFDFAQCEVGDLGFINTVSKEELWDRVKKFGFSSPVTPVLYLRRQFTEQRAGDQVFVIMDGSSILCLRCSGTDRHRHLYLGSISMESDAPFEPKHKITFLLPK